MDVLLEEYGDVLISIVGAVIIIALTDPVLNTVGGFINEILGALMG